MLFGSAAARLLTRVAPVGVDRGVRQRVRIGRDPRLLERILVREWNADVHEPVFPT